MKHLQEIIDLLNITIGPNREIDYMVRRDIEGWNCNFRVANTPKYTESADSSLALLHRVFPNGRWILERVKSNLWFCRIYISMTAEKQYTIKEMHPHRLWLSCVH